MSPVPEVRAAKTALVTGASGGIGAALAERFARDGVGLVLVARDAQALEALAARLRREHGVQVRVLVQDLAAADAAQRVHAAVEAAGIELDFLVNNAGRGVFGLFADTALDDELAMLALNVTAPTALCKLFLPQLLRRRGRILNVASLAAFQPGPYMAAYYGSKAYLLFLSEALATELDGRGVTVTTFCPGPTASGFVDAAGMHASGLILGKRLASCEAMADAGYRAMLAGRRVVVPGLANRWLARLVAWLPRRAVTRAVLAMSAPR